MLYKPKKERQWDSWIFKQNDTYFMYYINVSEGGSRWDGISLATSKDLLHWDEFGRVLDKDKDAIWLGTGMVQKIGDTYIMNYSLEKPKGCQKIYFAKSKDLYHFEKIEGAVCEPDDKYYMLNSEGTCDSLQRWDSLGIFDALSDNPPPYYAFCSANKKGARLCGKSGVLGLVTSDDGIVWKILPPAFSNSEVFPCFEVPEHFSMNNRHYAIFSSSSNLAFRFDDKADYMSGGTYYVVADNATGPYRLPECDCMLQGTRDNNMVCMNYVGRTFLDDNVLCYYHIWGEPTSDAWMGLVKKIDEKKPYELILKYYEKNELLKGRLLNEGDLKCKFLEARKVGKMSAVDWSQKDNAVFFRNNGSSGISQTFLYGCEKTNSFTDLRDGRIVEFDCSFNGLGAGVYFDTLNGSRACIMLNSKKQRVEFSYLLDGWGGNMIMKKDVFKDAKVYKKQAIKLFARRMFIELYIDDDYIFGWRLDGDEILPNNFGLYSEDSEGSFENICIYEMK